MIYTKKANFPYPVLMNFTDDYCNPVFELDVDMKENVEDYIINIQWEIGSEFIEDLLKSKKADLIFIIKSRDNQFYCLDNMSKRNDRSATQKVIPKSKLSINTRTVMQLMVQAKENIDFKENDDLNQFYDEIKSDIHIKRGNALGFSNTVIFDGSQKKPLQLFEKKIDKDLKSDIEIRLSEETIIILYKKEELQFVGLQNSRELNYPYIYMGLQKALISFINHANDGDLDEEVQIDEIELPESELEIKLYNLMKDKNIEELSMDNLDEVIYKISDHLLMRYCDVIRGICDAG